MTNLNVQYQNQEFELPVIEGSIGNPVVDVRGLGKTGLFTYDPGFATTASCKSSITFIDGDKGLLYYRGYPIEQIVEKSDYLDTCYLLFYGQRPTQEQSKYFKNIIARHSMLHDQMLSLYKGFRRDSHPMSVIIGVVGAMAAFYHDSLHQSQNSSPTASWQEITAHRLIAKMPNIIAQAYRYSKGLPFSYPRNNLSYCENFLHMMFSTPCEPYVVNPVLATALDRIFILHADHEQNASTSTVRLAGSSGANPFACIAAGVACLWGPAHGGANEAVLHMLEEIGSAENIPAHIKEVKEGKKRLMGFGHRVYKNMDPRAKMMKQTCKEVISALKLGDDPRFRLAMELEEVALNDPYFIERKLYPNVDFYSGIVLSAIGFPVRMFTPIFALARTVGWISHWHEMLHDKDQRIGRPRQLYIGEPKRDFV